MGKTYQETDQEIVDVKEALEEIMKLIMKDIHRMQLNNIKYKVHSVGDSGDNYNIYLAIDKPGSSGLASGLFAISMLGKIDTSNKGSWIPKNQKHMNWIIDITPKYFPNISYDYVIGLFKKNEKAIDKIFSERQTLNGLDIKKEFRQLKA